MVLFIMLYKVIPLTFESVNEISAGKCDDSNQKATERYYPMYGTIYYAAVQSGTGVVQSTTIQLVRIAIAKIFSSLVPLKCKSSITRRRQDKIVGNNVD